MPSERIEPLFKSPVDWDHESYCVEGCGRPAVHRRLTGMVDDSPVYELVCCQHGVADAE